MEERKITLELRSKSGGLVLGPSYAILTWPDRRLRKPAQPLDPKDARAREVLAAMEAVWKPDFAGLAAPQLGLPYRVIALPGENGPFFLFNPEIVARSPEVVEAEEGCLSLPGVVLRVARPAWVVVRGQDAEGTQRTLQLEGPLARAACHEIDHLYGLLILDRVGEEERRRALRILGGDHPAEQE